MEKRFITVVGKSSRKTAEAYLYSHSTITDMHQRADTIYLIVETTSDNPDYIANYQADRLSSGLFATKVHETREDAVAYMRESWEVDF